MENKLNRGKRDLDPAKRHVCKTISISPENHEKIKAIGKGSFSEGVRQLLILREKSGD